MGAFEVTSYLVSFKTYYFDILSTLPTSQHTSDKNCVLRTTSSEEIEIFRERKSGTELTNLRSEIRI